MRKVVVTLAVALLAAVPAPAGAAPRTPVADPPVSGRTCDSLWMTRFGGETETGALWGGPVTAADATALVALRCSVQVGEGNDRHSGADALSVGSGTFPGAAAVAPAPASFAHPYWSDAHLCTEVTVAGVPYYWDGAAGAWSASAEVTCDVALTPGRAVDEAMFRLCEVDGCFPPWYTDPQLTCPVLASLAPGVPGIVDIELDGDTYVAGEQWASCPPYGARS